MILILFFLFQTEKEFKTIILNGSLITRSGPHCDWRSIEECNDPKLIYEPLSEVQVEIQKNDGAIQRFVSDKEGIVSFFADPNEKLIFRLSRGYFESIETTIIAKQTPDHFLLRIPDIRSVYSGDPLEFQNDVQKEVDYQSFRIAFQGNWVIVEHSQDSIKKSNLSESPQQIEVAEFLKTLGAGPNVIDDQCNTALDLAIWFGDAKIIRDIYKAGGRSTIHPHLNLQELLEQFDRQSKLEEK